MAVVDPGAIDVETKALECDFKANSGCTVAFCIKTAFDASDGIVAIVDNNCSSATDEETALVVESFIGPLVSSEYNSGSCVLLRFDELTISPTSSVDDDTFGNEGTLSESGDNVVRLRDDSGASSGCDEFKRIEFGAIVLTVGLGSSSNVRELVELVG